MLCHRDKGGAVLSSRTLVADTGCTTTLLTPDFSSLVVSEAAKSNIKTERVLLGGKSQELRVKPKQLVEIPVVDVDGHVRLMLEEAFISDDVRAPLLACATKALVQDVPGQTNRVRVAGKGGEQFWVPVQHHGGLPVVKVHGGSPVAVPASQVGYRATAESQKAPNDVKIDVGGGVEISPSAVKDASPEKRAKVLTSLHMRLGHACGQRLYSTLKEKGWGDVYTERECSEATCDTCRILHRRKARIPAVKEVRLKSIKPGEVACHDIIEMPKGAGGYAYISVIIDAMTRRVAAMALKDKSEVTVHRQSYASRLETERMEVKKWSSFNKGLVTAEHAKGMFKRLMGKVIRSLGVPVETWPGFLPGVVTSMNSVVHPVVGKSPYACVGAAGAERLPSLAVGDVVSIVDPHSKSMIEGYFGGCINDQNVTIVVRTVDGGWSIKPVPTTAVKLVAWQGRGIDPRHAGGKRGVKDQAVCEEKLQCCCIPTTKATIS